MSELVEVMHMRQFTEISADAKFVKHSVAARFHGVHIKTIDRWVEAGLIPKPRIIRRQKYYDVAALAAAGAKRG
jgi:hypothetical protein